MLTLLFLKYILKKNNTNSISPSALIFRVLQRNCGKYPSCGWRINLTYDYIALLFGISFFPILDREPCKVVMRKACHASDAWSQVGENEHKLLK